MFGWETHIFICNLTSLQRSVRPSSYRTLTLAWAVYSHKFLYILSIVYVTLAGVALGVLQDTHSMGTTSVWLCSVIIVVDWHV